jgi:hypothetical protein
VTLPHVHGDHVADGDDSDKDSYVEVLDHVSLSLPFILPFLSFECVAQGLAAREPWLKKNGSNSFQTSSPLVSAQMPQNEKPKRGKNKQQKSSSEASSRSTSAASASGKTVKIGTSSTEIGDHRTVQAKPVSPTLNVVNAKGDHFAGKLEFDASAPRMDRPFLGRVASARGNDAFYIERVSLEAIARSLSHLKIKGAFGEKDYDPPDYAAPQIKCRASGPWMDVDYFPAWPLGVKEIFYLAYGQVY